MGTHHPFYFAGTGIDESQGITVFIKMSCLAVRTETVVSNTVGNDSDGLKVSLWALSSGKVFNFVNSTFVRTWRSEQDFGGFIVLPVDP